LRLLRLARLPARIEAAAVNDGAIVSIIRGHHQDRLRLGPNEVMFSVVHPDGSVDNSYTTNLLTTVGRDLIAASTGNATGKDGVLTASSSTSATPSGGGMTADQYKGWRVMCPITNVTTAPVYGNIGTNSTTVLTVDGWWVGTADTMTGTTPASTNGYHILPTGLARFMGLTADASAASAASTTLTSEITTNGLNRTKGTYAHTATNATYTLSVTFSVSGGPQTVHRGGLFTAANTTAGGILMFETVASADAIVTTSDTLNATWTVTIS
jgi:hypothetical protein